MLNVRQDFHPEERSAFRKTLGGIKRDLLNNFIYKRAAKKGQAARSKQKSLVDKLPRIEKCQDPTFEIHMLCCNRDIDMGIWASWSILRFLKDKAKLIVHSDGTMTEDDKLRWSNVIGSLEVIDKHQRDEKIKQELAIQCPLVYEWRCENWASAQLVDMQYFGNSRTILLMDSDVLTFSYPDEVVAALTAGKPRFGWCNDLINAYSAPPKLIKEITGKTIANKLCAGFLVSPRLSIEDYASLEEDLEKLKKDGRINLNHFWSCQTYYALIADRYKQSKAFSNIYNNTNTSTKREQPMRHFVGIPSVRYRYFIEGIPRIINDAFE